MLELALVTTLLACSPLTDEDGPKPPEPAQVEAALEKLGAAFEDGEPADRVQAIADASPVLHPDVVDAIAKGMKDGDGAVVTASLEALRFMDLPAAVDALHKAHKSNRALSKDAEQYARLLKAIGQHGSPDSLKVLAKDPFDVRQRQVAKTRILALGRIRSAEAVGELMALMQKVGRAQAGPFMEDFRLALTVLTGADQGPTRDAWIAWWNDNKKTLVVKPELPELPKRFAQSWTKFWDEKPKRADGEEEEGERRRERRKKRKGGDGE